MYIIDSCQFVAVNDESQYSGKNLLFLTLLMVVNSDDDVGQTEQTVFVLGDECE